MASFMPQQAFVAAQIQMAMADRQQAMTIYAQIAADAQKQQMQRIKIMADTRTKVFEIQQDITVNRCKVADKANQAMDAYIRG